MDNLEYPDTDAALIAFEQEIDDRYYELQKRATLAAERQAAALESIVEYTRHIAGQMDNQGAWFFYNLNDKLNRIAVVLERADNLSKMFGGEA